ncbi:winged helix DNA-binding domain-containing protein [Pseudonocardia yunnanensis]|uniref:winged helix DNA-binding domain-containing protein n=1 Tax=Pseudonocardia yunnanensis TaxID=58107 RepID=UPI0031CEFAD3
MVAVQAQDWRSARLALRARSDGLTTDALDAAAADGSLVVSWLLRGTLHLVRAEDHGWLLGFTARAGMVQSRRRLAEEGVTEPQVDTALRVITSGPADGARSRQELTDQLAAAGVPVAGQAVYHCLRLAALHGRAVLVPGAEAGSLLVRAIYPPAAPTDRDAAVVELARRYLRGHGPATAADLAAWSGLPLRDARAGLRGLGAALVECADGLVDLACRDAAGGDVPGVPPRLLPPFDPFLLGWADRSFAVPEHLRSRVHPGGGMLRAIATVDGAVVGTWTLRRRDGRPEVALDVAEPAHVAALALDVADVLRFSG